MENVSYYTSDQFHEEFANIDVQKLQKFSSHLTTTKASLIAVYTTIFLVGLAGNSWVACIHCCIWRHSGQQGVGRNEAPRAVQIYILALCFCDLIVLGFFAALISDLVYGQWIVPSTFLCRLYLSSESVNKFCSPFLLVAMSAYCYYSIRKSSFAANQSISSPSRFSCVNTQDESHVAVVVVLASISLVLLLVSPVYVYGDLYYVVYENGTEVTEIYQKCAFVPPADLYNAFTIYSFIGGYVVPAVLFTLFYFLLLYRVRQHALAMRRQSSEYLSKVARTTTGLVLFYLLCWSPYWVFLLYRSFALDEDARTPTVPSVVLGYIIHTLPYINCAGYPILYTLMNRNIRAAYQKVVSFRRRGKLSRREVTATTTLL